MDSQHDLYATLHVQPDAPEAIIRASYRALMQQLKAHPDLGGEHEAAARINEAYRVLTNPAARADYDARRQAPASPVRPEPTGKPEPDPGDTIHTATARAGCFFCGSLRPGDQPLRPGDSCVRCRSPLYPADRRRLEQGTQRAIQRLSRRHPLQIYTSWPQAQPDFGESRDISLHGIRLVTGAALEVGKLVKIDSEVCHAVVRIVNQQRNGTDADSPYLYGAEFISVIFPHPRGGFVSEKA